MGRSTTKSIKFSKEDLELIAKAVAHYNKFVTLGKTNESELIRVASLDRAKQILASKKIIISFKEKEN